MDWYAHQRAEHAKECVVKIQQHRIQHISILILTVENVLTHQCYLIDYLNLKKCAIFFNCYNT